jgi:DNA-binding NarL/FixJ family response regulator
MSAAPLAETPIRVLVASDVAFWRASLRDLLAGAGFHVVATAADVDRALESVARSRPDVVVASFDPGSVAERRHNVEVALAFRRRFPATGLVLLTREVRAATALELLGADARSVGYLLLDRVESVDVLAEIVQAAAFGRSSVDPAIASELLERARRAGHPLLSLTPRECDVLGLMAEGRSNAGIARRLFVTEHTVEKHVRHVFQKLGIDPAPDDHRRVLAVLAYLEET